MNSFKLLPCGKIIFYNLSAVDPGIASHPYESAEGNRVFSNPDSTNECQETRAVNLGLSDVAISDNPSQNAHRARRGTKGITPHGRNMIRAGCHWLEEQFGKKNLTFLTTTLPDAALMACSPQTWSIVVNRFIKQLIYHLDRVGLSTQVVGCIEIQGERLKHSSGIPPLHLHLLFQGRQPYGQWGLGKKFYQGLWAQVCQTVWQLDTEFEQSCRCECIRKSGVSYMSKYMSKGGDLLSQSNPDLLPSAWYTLSSSLKEIIKATILKGNSHLAEQLYAHFYNGELLSWARHVYSTEHGDGSQYLIAWVGQIATRSKFWEIHDKLHELIHREKTGKWKAFTFDF